MALVRRVSAGVSRGLELLRPHNAANSHHRRIESPEDRIGEVPPKIWFPVAKPSALVNPSGVYDEGPLVLVARRDETAIPGLSPTNAVSLDVHGGEAPPLERPAVL